jgi:hypothetical protein
VQPAYANDGGRVRNGIARTVIALLLAVGIIAAICGFIASALALGNKRRARGFFAVGFFCGLMVGAILHGRRRGVKALRAVARNADVRLGSGGIYRGTGRSAVRSLAAATSHLRSAVTFK